MADFTAAANKILEVEGGYQDSKMDKGNYVCPDLSFPGKGIECKDGQPLLIGTNMGISAPVYAKYLGRIPSKEEMKNLTKSEALDIYNERYWDLIDGDSIENQALANLIFDTAVNHGVYKAKQIVSDIIGKPYSSENINAFDSEELFSRIKKRRQKIFKAIGGTFLPGWMNRLKKFTFRSKKNATGVLLTSAVLISFSLYLYKTNTK